MGTPGDTPRKPKHRMGRVKYDEASNIQLAGLAETNDPVSGTRLGHKFAHGRAQNIGKFGTFFLWCLGRRRKDPDEQPES